MRSHELESFGADGPWSIIASTDEHRNESSCRRTVQILHDHPPQHRPDRF